MVEGNAVNFYNILESSIWLDKNEYSGFQGSVSKVNSFNSVLKTGLDMHRQDG